MGLDWPGADLFLVALFLVYLVFSLAAVVWLKTRAARPGKPGLEALTGPLRWLAEVFDFFCGDWWVFDGLALTLVVVLFPWPGRTAVWVVGILASLCVALWRQTVPRDVAFPANRD